MGNNKTRFTVLSMFVERQIFSAAVQADGSFSIFLPQATWSMPDGTARTFKETHISAHTGKQRQEGYGFKVKRSGLTAEGEKFDGSVIVKTEDNSFIYPIYSTFTAIHTPPLLKKIGKADEKVELIGVTGIDDTLCYTIFASTPDRELPVVQGFSKHVHTLGDLHLTIYMTFFHVNNAMFNITGSETPQFNRLNGSAWAHEHSTNDPSSFVESFDERQIEMFLQATHYELANNYLRMLPIIGEDSTVFSVTPRQFHRWPSVDDPMHNTYGVMARSKNPVYTNPFDVHGRPKTEAEKAIRGAISVIQKPSELIKGLPHELLSKIPPNLLKRIQDGEFDKDDEEPDKGGE